jgi:hypothetical protein
MRKIFNSIFYFKRMTIPKYNYNSTDNNIEPRGRLYGFTGSLGSILVAN